MRNRQFEISQRDWDLSIMEKRNLEWDGCYNCGSQDGMCEDADGNKWACPICNKSGDGVPIDNVVMCK